MSDVKEKYNPIVKITKEAAQPVGNICYIVTACGKLIADNLTLDLARSLVAPGQIILWD